MKLSHLANLAKKENIFISLYGDCEFTSMEFDSRLVKKDCLFFVKGVAFKEEFLISSIQSGAIAYVAEKEHDVDCPHLIVSDVRVAMALFSKEFFDDPVSKFPLTGITGTKGKTSTAYMLNSILCEHFGIENVGLISTIEAFCGKTPIKKSGTTPEALPLYTIFDNFAKNGVKAATMEVSSQALQYDRVKYVDFFTGIYLNLSLDHQSPGEHSSFEEYKKAKMRLFTMCKNAVINIDDEYAAEFVENTKCEKLYTFGISNTSADFVAENIIMSKSGTTFNVTGPFGKEQFTINIPGVFNIYNALAAIISAYLLGADMNSIRSGLEKTVINGRMNIFTHNDITIITDYAHNGVAVEAVFEYIEKFYPDSRIICLYGCPGGKAFDRRKSISQAAAKHAGVVILTSDDPNFESPEAIIDELKENLGDCCAKCYEIVDRELAIQKAIEIAKPGDVIFLAGKGHEHSQVILGKSVSYKGDMETAKESLGV